MKFDSSKIKWIKNVKQVMEGDWAYDHEKCGKTFQLHWSSSQKFASNAEKANIGDIIVLFQKPHEINGKRNHNIYLTHLVTPEKQNITTDEKFPRFKHRREMQLLAIADPINAICVNKVFNFSKVGRGFTSKIEHLISKQDLDVPQVKDKIWDLFKPFFCEGKQDSVV